MELQDIFLEDDEEDEDEDTGRGYAAQNVSAAAMSAVVSQQAIHEDISLEAAEAAMRSTLRSTLRSALGNENAATLREMRRTGQLASLSTASYATLMRGRLYEYSEVADSTYTSVAGHRPSTAENPPSVAGQLQFAGVQPPPSTAGLLSWPSGQRPSTPGQPPSPAGQPPSTAGLRSSMAGTDLGDTFGMLQSSILSGDVEDEDADPEESASGQSTIPWPSGSAPPSSDGGESMTATSVTATTNTTADTAVSSTWWQTYGSEAGRLHGRTAGTSVLGGATSVLGGATVSSTNSFSSAEDEVSGGDGGNTFDMHALLREMVAEGELTTSLAEQAHRMLQLGAAASGRRLSEQEIDALPKLRFEEAELQSCAICLEVYQQGELITELHCQHFFHVSCLTEWLRRSTLCPLCRMSQAAE